MRGRERRKERAERREGGWMGDGLRGGHTGITIIKKPLTAHTTPEQLSDELRRRGKVGGKGGEERRDREREGAADGERRKEKNVQAQQK